MLKFQAQVYRINDISGWHDRRELTLAPSFQRRRVWSPRGKSFLIDSILRGMPLPQFFVREMVLPREKRTIREVVDGQQRLSTILAYLSDDFTVLPVHSDQYARVHFSDLPEDTQRNFLSFPLSVNILQGAEDRDVLEIFARLNSYTVPLNQQEKLNAKYVGAFKKAIVELAGEHLAFWKRHRILSDQATARMRDLEFTSELVAAMLLGLQNQKKVISTLFSSYEDEFPQVAFIAPRFAETLQMCESFVGNDISATVFQRTSLFYSLYCALYDARYGFGTEPGARPREMVLARHEGAQQQLVDLSDSLEAVQVQGDALRFYQTTRQSTDKLPQREIRHAILSRIVRPVFEG